MALLPVVCQAYVTEDDDVVEVTGTDASTGDPVVLSDLNCRPNATVFLAGVGYLVKAKVDSTHFQLERDYEGATVEDPDPPISCSIAPFTPEMANRVELAASLRDYSARVALLSTGASPWPFYQSIGFTGAADPGPGKCARDAEAWADSTAMYVDLLDASPANNSQAAIIDLWVKGTHVAPMDIRTGAYALFQLTAAPIDEGGWRRLSGMQYLGGAGQVTDGPDLRLIWWTDGRDLQIDESGTFAERDAFDEEDKGFVYYSEDGDGDEITTGVLYFKKSNATADWSAPLPYQGPQGEKGWSPQLVAENDGARRVFKLLGYVGGEGTAPTANVGDYLKGDGTFTATIGDAVDFRGEPGPNGLAGGGMKGIPVAVVDASEGDPATDYEAGDTIDGHVLDVGELVLRATEGGDPLDGVYPVPAAGAATRHPDFDSYDDLVGGLFTIMQGSTYADTIWHCTSDPGGTIDVTALVFSEAVASGADDFTRAAILSLAGAL